MKQIVTLSYTGSSPVLEAQLTNTNVTNNKDSNMAKYTIVFCEKGHPASTDVERVYSVNRSEVRSIRKNS